MRGVDTPVTVTLGISGGVGMQVTVMLGILGGVDTLVTVTLDISAGVGTRGTVSRSQEVFTQGGQVMCSQEQFESGLRSRDLQRIYPHVLVCSSSSQEVSFPNSILGNLEQNNFWAKKCVSLRVKQRLDIENVRFTDPHHFNADPVPTFHLNVDPDRAFHFNADADPDADPDPAPHQSDGNL
jgi:hypothetical protein